MHESMTDCVFDAAPAQVKPMAVFTHSAEIECSVLQVLLQVVYIWMKNS